MNELNFTQEFAVVALNRQRSSELTNAKRVALRCIAEATILELYLNNSFTDEGILSFE